MTIKPTIRPGTWDSYRDIVRLHIVPALGTYKLQALSAATINAFYAAKLESGLSPKTVRNIHVPLRKGLADAMRWGLVTRNAADLADPPKDRDSGDADMPSWTAPELRTFLESVEGHRLYAAWHLAANTGMRRGEVLGARWSDLDLDAARLRVRQTLISVHYQIMFSTPKTKPGRRQIELDQGTVAALRAHRKAQAAEKLAHPDYQDHDLIFCKPDGSPLHPQTFSQAFERLVARSGLPTIPFHGLRHTHIELSLQAGVRPDVVSRPGGSRNGCLHLGAVRARPSGPPGRRRRGRRGARSRLTPTGIPRYPRPPASVGGLSLCRSLGCK